VGDVPDGLSGLVTVAETEDEVASTVAQVILSSMVKEAA
jgi:hypothetical protein